MANNRMFLVHKPTMLGVRLGRRGAWGWHSPDSSEELARFYLYLERNSVGSQDDFHIFMEDCGESSCYSDWSYTDDKQDGFWVFKDNKAVD